MTHHLAGNDIGGGLEDFPQIVASPAIAFAQVSQHSLARGGRDQPLHRPLEPGGRSRSAAVMPALSGFFEIVSIRRWACLAVSRSAFSPGFSSR